MLQATITVKEQNGTVGVAMEVSDPSQATVMERKVSNIVDKGIKAAFEIILKSQSAGDGIILEGKSEMVTERIKKFIGDGF